MTIEELLPNGKVRARRDPPGVTVEEWNNGRVHKDPLVIPMSQLEGGRLKMYLARATEKRRLPTEEEIKRRKDAERARVISADERALRKQAWIASLPRDLTSDLQAARTALSEAERTLSQLETEQAQQAAKPKAIAKIREWSVGRNDLTAAIIACRAEVDERRETLDALATRLAEAARPASPRLFRESDETKAAKLEARNSAIAKIKREFEEAQIRDHATREFATWLRNTDAAELLAEVLK